MSEPVLKCENNAVLSKTILKNCLFLLKYPILAVLGLGEILNFQISSKKKFYNINYWFQFRSKVQLEIERVS